jgi:hypothetical protein
VPAHHDELWANFDGSGLSRHWLGGNRPRRSPADVWIGGSISYAIDALVADGDMVAVVWTGTIPSGATFWGLSLYNAAGGLLRSTRHTTIGALPS